MSLRWKAISCQVKRDILLINENASAELNEVLSTYEEIDSPPPGSKRSLNSHSITYVYDRKTHIFIPDKVCQPNYLHSNTAFLRFLTNDFY